MADPSRRASRNDDTADTANPAPGSANVKTAGTGNVEKDIKFSLITDSLPVLIAYIGKDFRYRFVNKAYESLHKETHGNIQGKHVREIIGDQAWAAIHKYIERSLNGETVNYEEKITYKNNMTRYIRGTLVPHCGPAQKIEGVYALVSDITEQKHFEESLRKSEDRYGALFENVPVGICINSPDGRIIAYNPTLQKITGYTRADMANAYTKNFYARKYEKDRLLRDLRSKGSLRDYHVDLRRKNGEVFHAMVNIVPHVIAGEKTILTVIQDVTKQKKDRDAMIESERRLTDIINFLPDATFALDREGKIIAWNRAIEEMTGIKAVAILGKANYEHSIPFYGKRQPMLADLVLKPDRNAEKKYSFIDKDMDRLIAESLTPLKVNGRSIYLWAKASPVYDMDGNITGVIQSIRDITGQKEAEERRRESEERYRTAIEYSNDGVAIVKGNTHLYVNQRFCEIFGFDSPDEIIGETHVKTIHPDDLAKVQDINARRQRGEEVPKRYEFKGIRKDGGILYIEVSAANSTFRGEAVTLAFFRDVTERKLASDALRDSEMKFHTLFDCANDAIFLMDGETFIDCNRKALSIFGCSKEDIIGQTPSTISPPQQPDGSSSADKTQKKIGMALKGVPQFFKWQHQRSDGTTFDTTVTLNELELGGKKYIQAIIRDNEPPDNGD
ncbi:MAG TPA: PAS domain-containing protein [Syntrophorhabdaceae bacterium]|nr:PAS domain-containing protein [Syntrophorhabdaceae bacterium]